MITEGHYIEPDRAVDQTPAAHLERTLRPAGPDGSLLVNRPADREDELLPAARAAAVDSTPALERDLPASLSPPGVLPAIVLAGHRERKRRTERGLRRRSRRRRRASGR